jgi:transposase
MERRKRTSFPKVFKQEAVRLLEQSGRPAAAIARELGIRRNQLYKWQEQIRAKGEGSFPGSGRQSGESALVRTLRQENARLQEEVAILKKAAAYFARESK